jgi:hypothetical protein
VRGLRVFENRVQRRIFGPKRDEVTGEWRKLHNEELHNLYSSPDIIREVKSSQVKANEVGRACGTHRRGEKSVQGLGGKGKRPLGRPRRRWENGIRMDLREIGSGQGPVAGCGECGDEPLGSCATELVSVIHMTFSVLLIVSYKLSVEMYELNYGLVGYHVLCCS